MRDLQYQISLETGEAEAKLQRFETRAVSATNLTGAVSKAERDLGSALKDTDAQTAAMTSTMARAASAGGTFAQRMVDVTASASTQTRALEATDRMLADLEKRYPSVATSTVELQTATVGAATATEGLVGQVTGAIATFAPYAIAAQVVTEVIIGWVEAHEKAALAAETLAAKQDVVNKAFAMTGVVMSYGDAVKYVNEQFARTNPLADNASKALQSFNLAVAAGPTAMEIESLRLLGKAGDDVRKVLQDDLVRMGGQDGLARAMDLLRDKSVTASAQFAEWAKSIGLSSTTIAVLKDQVKAEADAQENAAKATKKASDAYEQQQKAVQKLIDTANQQRGTLLAQILGIEDVEKAEKAIDVLRQFDDVTKLVKDEQKQLATTFDRAIDILVTRGDQVPARLLLWAAALKAVTIPAADLVRIGQSVRFPQYSTPLTMSDGSSLPAYLANIGGRSGRQFATSWWEGFEAEMKPVLASMPQLLLREFANGSGIEGAARALGVQIGARINEGMASAFKSGKLTGNYSGAIGYAGIGGGIAGAEIGMNGGSTGQQFGEIGMASAGTASAAMMTGASIGAAAAAGAVSFGIGAAVIGLIAWAKSTGPSAQELSGRDAEGKFESSLINALTASQRVAAGPSRLTQSVTGLSNQYVAGGMAEADAYKLANEDFARLLAAEQAGGAYVQQVIDSITVRLDRMRAAQQAVQDGVDKVSGAWNAAGRYIPEDIQASVRGLLEMNGLTDAQRKSLEGLLKSAKPSFQDLMAIADKYKISLEQLGPAFQQKDIEDKARSLYQDFKLLTDNGADAGGVLAGMKSKFQDLVTESLKSGAKIPENLRPLLKVLIESGQLTDLSGKKLTDMSGISFEDTPVEETLADLNKAIQDLIKAIQTMSDTIAKIPDKTVTVTTKYETEGEIPGGPSRDGTGTNAPRPGKYGWNDDGTPDWDNDKTNSMATEAFVRRPTLALVGDVAGGEFVLKPSTIAQWLNAASLAGANSTTFSRGRPLSGFGSGTAGAADVAALRSEMAALRADNAQLLGRVADGVEAQKRVSVQINRRELAAAHVDALLHDDAGLRKATKRAAA